MSEQICPFCKKELYLRAQNGHYNLYCCSDDYCLDKYYYNIAVYYNGEIEHSYHITLIKDNEWFNVIKQRSTFEVVKFVRGAKKFDLALDVSLADQILKYATTLTPKDFAKKINNYLMFL